jgi:hypothetical protein
VAICYGRPRGETLAVSRIKRLIVARVLGQGGSFRCCGPLGLDIGPSGQVLVGAWPALVYQPRLGGCPLVAWQQVLAAMPWLGCGTKLHVVGGGRYGTAM